MLYLQLLSYCHKGKDTAWHSIRILNKRIGTTTKIRDLSRNTPIEYGLIKKVLKQKSIYRGYDHNLYQIILLDKEKALLPPAETLLEETEEAISGVAEESPSLKKNNPNRINVDDEKSLKKERIKEELKKLNLDIKSIDKIILNYSSEDIEEKLDLLKMKRNVINPAGWLITALQVNYLNPESLKKKMMIKKKTKENQPENKILKSEKILPRKKEKQEKNRLSREEELEWIRKIRFNILKGK